MRRSSLVHETTTRASLQEPRTASFSIAFGRRPKMIAVVRRVVADFYGTLYDEIAAPVELQRGWTSQVSQAAHELVENSIRHGLEGDAIFSIRVDPDGVDPGRVHRVRVATRNRADAAQRERVLRRINELRTTPDLFAYYLALLTESAEHADGAGLGLARVRVEARMELGCSIDGDELEISASARVGAGATVRSLPRGDGPERARPR
jgi:hypothetical protein